MNTLFKSNSNRVLFLLTLCIAFTLIVLNKNNAKEFKSIDKKQYSAENKNSLQIEILSISNSGLINAKISNLLKERINIWNEGSSWGAAHWKVVQIRRTGELEVFYQSPYQTFTRNVASGLVLEPNSSVEKKFNINGGNWCSCGECSKWFEVGIAGKTKYFSPGDQIILIYDVPFSLEAKQLDIWYGLVSDSKILP